MRIATFNINDINRRLSNLLEWLRVAEPDVVCLQELKATDASFPEAAIQDAGYGAVWRGQRTWNGGAILAKNAKPILTRDDLPGDPADTQSRYIEAAVNGVLIASIYLPNGNPQPGPKFGYKLAWFEWLIAHAAALYATGVPAVLAGDYNVVPTDQDIYPTKSWANDALLQPESRAAFRRLLDQGWTDAIRTLHPSDPMYTFWDYKRERWRRDAGLRIDHLLLSAPLVSRLAEAGIDRDVRGQKGASDHAPAWIMLRGLQAGVAGVAGTSETAGRRKATLAGRRNWRCGWASAPRRAGDQGKADPMTVFRAPSTRRSPPSGSTLRTRRPGVIRSSVRMIAHRPDTIVGLGGTRIASVVLGRLAVVS